jgi:plastocyanin
MRVLGLLLIGLLVATKAFAADLTVNVRTPSGQPVADAVVEVYPASGTGGAPIKFAWPQEMAQRNLQFDPFVLVTPVGGDVAFPNRDSVRHHVYSFSRAKRFELKLYGHNESPSVKFDKTGVVALGCNIHDSMVAFIKVVDTPYAIKTTAAGVASLHGLPNGSATLKVWHPYMRGADNQVVQTIALRDGAPPVAVTADVRAPVVHHSAY